MRLLCYDIHILGGSFVIDVVIALTGGILDVDMSACWHAV